MKNIGRKVREKAHDQIEDMSSLGYHYLHLGASPGSGRAHLCSLEIHRRSFHISPHLPAPL